MEMRLWLIGAGGAIALAASAAAVKAAPAGAMTGDLKVAAQAASSVDSVAYRRCWRNRNGDRVCRRVSRRNVYGYQYSPNVPEAYPVGSARWWQEMDRQDRGGRGRQ